MYQCAVCCSQVYVVMYIYLLVLHTETGSPISSVVLTIYNTLDTVIVHIELSLIKHGYFQRDYMPMNVRLSIQMMILVCAMHSNPPIHYVCIHVYVTKFQVIHGQCRVHIVCRPFCCFCTLCRLRLSFFHYFVFIFFVISPAQSIQAYIKLKV